MIGHVLLQTFSRRPGLRRAKGPKNNTGPSALPTRVPLDPVKMQLSSLALPHRRDDDRPVVLRRCILRKRLEPLQKTLEERIRRLRTARLSHHVEAAGAEQLPCMLAASTIPSV